MDAPDPETLTSDGTCEQLEKVAGRSNQSEATKGQGPDDDTAKESEGKLLDHHPKR